MRDLPCFNSPSFCMTSVADRKAILSSFERLSIYSWIAFWNASFFIDTGVAIDWGFRDCCAGLGVITGPARALDIIRLSVLALGIEVELLSRVVSGALVKALPKAGLGVGDRKSVV